MNTEKLIEILHQGQTRKTGEPYTVHLRTVRDILRNEGINDEYILDAALLHDSLEDSYITKQFIIFYYGKHTAGIVDAVSKQSFWNTRYCKMKNHMDSIKLFGEEALLIKMADRLHNLQTLDGFSAEKQGKYIQETEKFLLPMFQSMMEGKVYYDVLQSLYCKIQDEIHDFYVSNTPHYEQFCQNVGYPRSQREHIHPTSHSWSLKR